VGSLDGKTFLLGESPHPSRSTFSHEKELEPLRDLLSRKKRNQRGKTNSLAGCRSGIRALKQVYSHKSSALKDLFERLLGKTALGIYMF
ncbi:Hypothetical protein FKW44_020305, partial [Caligus rogercresseyi]